MSAPYFSKDIRDYLIANTALTPVSIDTMTPKPINQYAVIEYSGPANIKTHGSVGNAGASVQLDEGLLQVQARHANAQQARINIMAAVDALDGLSNMTVNGVFYTYITGVSRPRLLYVQEDGSSVFIWECRVQSRRTGGGQLTSGQTGMVRPADF